MQILYWHLTRPQTSTCGGSLSPPLLQRRDGTGASARSNFPKSSIFEQALSPGHTNEPYHHQNLGHQIFATPLTETGDTGDLNQSQHRAMEIENDDQTPTFYLLNAVDLPEDEDSALNHHLDLIHGQQNEHHEHSYNGPLVAVGNGPGGGGGGGNGPPGGHYADQPRKSMANKRKIRRSNDLASILCIEDESDDESAVNIGPSKSKKAKLVVNLYPEDEGYSFGYQLPGSKDCSESHVIPYSERYLLDSIDAQQIPHKMLCRMEDRQGVNLMRYRNQVIAEIRDYRKTMLLPTQNLNSSSTLPSTVMNGSASSALINGSASESEKQKPVVKQVMLRPTTESLLCDFDMLVEKALDDRAGWSALLRQSINKNDVSHLVADGSDSDFEYEVDLEESQLNKSNYLTYDQRLELEKNFINQTAGPLCLDPSPEVGIIANRIQFEQLKWNTEELRIAAKRWEENPFKNHQISTHPPDETLDAPSFADGRMGIEPFHTFVMSVKSRTHGLRANESEKDVLRLPPIVYQDYPDVEPPKNMDDVLRIGQTPEPAQLRLFPNENSVRKIEEYILETERRKRPHTTTLSIFQRNGMESYFGELEMESFLDPNQPRIGATPAPSSTKCQFELGSSRNVTLYVKQFSDIFTEDGRRPCKITYQKVGQPPQVVYTNSYKPATQANATANAAASSATAPTHTTITAATVSVPQAVTSLSTPIVINAPISSVSLASGATTTTSATATITVPTSHIIHQTASISHTGSPTINLVPTSSITIPGIVSAAQQQHAQLQRPPTPASSATIAVIGGGTSATTSAPSLPPVQIVHPQPRTTPQQQKIQLTAAQRQGAIQIFSQQNQAQNITVPPNATPSANVNLNVNLNSTGMGGMTPQQVLTRPHIVNVSLQQQQQAAAQQQLLQLTQQRLLRMKQQQQPNTALAKLLLTNLQSKPITVAVQPTPQNPANAVAANNTSPVCSSAGSPASASCSANNNSNTSNVSNPGSNITIASPGDQSQQNPLGSPIMITSPPSVSSAMTNPSPNVNVNVNASPNVSVNLNTISLDGLISVSSANLNYGTATATLNSSGQTASNLVAASNVNLGLSRITSSGSPGLNILRLNNNTGTVSTSGASTMQLASLQRQLAVSNALNGNVSILQQSGQQPQQRILINANSMNNLNLSSVGSSGEIEELSVPDLQTLLGGQPIQISQLGQNQHILTNAGGAGPSQTTIDTTNLNLNLNVNLNSGTVVNNGEGQVQQHQIAKIQGGEWTTTAQAPPFLVFISPLRPMSIATQNASGGRQVNTSGTLNNPSTLNLSLGAVKSSQQQQHQQLIHNQTGKVPEPPTRILLGACNNGVAIKRELPPSSVPNSMLATGSGDSNISQNNPVESNVSVDGHNLLDSQQVVGNNSDVVVDGVDSLFNAISEAIGPEQLHKLDAIGGSLGTVASSVASSISTSHNPSQSMVESTSTGMRVVPSSTNTVNITASSSNNNTSSSSESAISNNNKNSTNVITLSDLLGSPTVVSSSTGNVPSFPSLILSSVNGSNSGPTINSSVNNAINSSPTLSSLLNSSSAPPASSAGQLGIMTFSSSATTTMTQSSIVSSTPRLSALLAGTPSADTVVVRANGPTTLLSPTGTADSSSGTSSTSYGTLLDRLAASLNQPQGNTVQMRTGASRLNPIATATPSVVLEHPVLAATLTQQQQQQQQQPGGNAAAVGMNRGSTYRQIAPAPTSSLSATTTTSIGNNNVTVISSSDVQSHMQSPQLINLLGLVGNSSSSPGPGGTRTIRISASSPANNPSSGSASR
ncbi:unnamed protein product [Orchesella dallaii]|uniref:Spt20-like SEP domain-containing protein n=1 Tax=Orchesella dallaii TaxID=48710 RepID=A0ABP1QIT4_9HEXA